MKPMWPILLRRISHAPHCGGRHWKKESDILDVWFDSGTSFAAVMLQRPEGAFPADLYLEGSDQHRGWFHSSLLVGEGTRGQAPYRTVLTHGYVVDGEGRKQSKSLGNVVAPQEVIDKYGAELLRLWVSSVDYREDIRYSEEIMSRLVDAYRRIRNTCRYLLGNISDLTPDLMVKPADMLPLDRYAMDLALTAHARVEEAYLNYEFHKVFHTLHGLCATDLSSFYLDVLKDRLYSSLPDSRERRSAQTALYEILLLLLRDMAPCTQLYCGRGVPLSARRAETLRRGWCARAHGAGHARPRHGGIRPERRAARRLGAGHGRAGGSDQSH